MEKNQALDGLTPIARSLDTDALITVAGAVLGIAEPSLLGPPNVVKLSAHHYDSRTLGMLHVAGQATGSWRRP